YFTGDGARMDEDGFFWLMGRIDDVINVAGHRIGTMEVESALVSHEKVAEAAVVGKPHPVKGQSLVAYVVLKRGQPRADGLKKELQKHVREAIGAIAVPDDLYITEKLPKTRSGKIMRRVIRSLVSGQEIGDTTTLEDPGAADEVRKWLAGVPVRFRVDDEERRQEGESDRRDDDVHVLERLERVQARTGSRPSRPRDQRERDSDRQPYRKHDRGPQRRAHGPFPLTSFHVGHLSFAYLSRCSRRRPSAIR